MLGSFISLSGCHDQVEALLLYLIFPKINYLFTHALASKRNFELM